MLNLTRCLCTPRKLFCVGKDVFLVMSILNCQQWSMSNTFISTVPLRIFQQLSSFLALPGCASRWTVQWPSGDIWQEVSTSTRSQVAEISWSGNCLTPVSWELSWALQRWAFHTSWTTQVFEHLIDSLAIPVDNISCFQNSQYCFDCEDKQIVKIGHNMWYVIRVSPYGWHSYLPIVGQKVWLDTRLGQAVVYGEFRKIYWNLQEKMEIS